MKSIDVTVDEMLPHYEKHLADTGRRDTPREVMRYMIKAGYIKPEFPPKPEYSPGLMIYEHKQKSRRPGW